MVVSIGAIASAAQGVSYFERDGYYTKGDPRHLDASAWAGRGAEALELRGPVEPGVFQDVMEGTVPDGTGRRLGRRERDGSVTHRPGRDLTFSAPKSVSIVAMLGGDAAVAAAHDAAVRRTLAWLEASTIQTRIRDPESGLLVHTGGQKMVAATFRHEVSRNLDPQLHTHAVVANMVQGGDGKWRTMSNETLYRRQKLIGMVYRSELARELAALGYGIEKTHADGRFEIAGVPRGIVEAFSTRRAEIEAAMEARGFGDTGSNPQLAERAALMTRAHKREVDREALQASWREQAASLGFSPDAVAEAARRRRSPAVETEVPKAEASRDRNVAGAGETNRGPGRDAARGAGPAMQAVSWAMEHLSEREAVFARSDLLAAALAWKPGAVSAEAAGQAINALQRDGRLHAAPAFAGGEGLTTDTAIADERETIDLMRTGRDRGRVLMRRRKVHQHLNNGPLTGGQKQAVTAILSSKDRIVGVQGYAGTGKTAMLNRARALAEKSGYRMLGLAPSASAVQTLATESGIESETLQGFLARNAGVAEGRLTRRKAAATCGTPSRRPCWWWTRARSRPPCRRATCSGSPARAAHSQGRAGRRREAARRRRCRQALRPAAAGGHADRGDGRDIASARACAEGGGRGQRRGRHPQGLREAGAGRGGGEGGQHRGRRRRALAQALAGGAREHRRDGAEPRAPRRHQRAHQGAARERGQDPRPGVPGRAAGLPGLHAGREGARRQLRAGRRGGVPPPLQAARRRQGRRAQGGRGGPPQPHRGPGGRTRRHRRLEARPGGRPSRAGARSTASSRSSCARATAFAGPATTGTSGS